MNIEIKLKSNDNRSKVTIQNGELISYQFLKTEIMHQRSDPGWGTTEIEMFPIIGSTKGNNFSIDTPKKTAKLDQHGILRAMDYSLKAESSNTVSFCKNYIADTLISNPKFPKKSTLPSLDWPYDFEFTKTFKLSNDQLLITFEITSEKNMPFMMGFHPAFKIHTKTPLFESKDQQISLSQILEAGSNALPIKNCNQLTLSNNGKVKINIQSSKFKHIMLWSPTSNMVCVEPITFYPSSVSAQDLYKGFDSSSGYEKFEVVISPSVA